MKLARAVTVASGFMQMEPARLRGIARALADRQAAQAAWKAPPRERVPVDWDQVDHEVSRDASLTSMQASLTLLTRAIDMLK